MKQWIALILCTILCGGGFVASYTLVDNENPVIEVKNHQSVIGCSISFDELLNNASASDNEGIREFFIEEKEMTEIVDNRKLTYVAIDDSGNVTKETLYVDVLPEVSKKEIVLLQPLQIEVKHDFFLSEYFKISNGCGWTFEGDLEIEGMDLKNIGSYEVTVTAVNQPDTEPLVTTLEVKEFDTPIIVLKYDEVKLDYGEEFDFTRIIDYVEDNTDSEETLLETLEIVSELDITIPGVYEMTFMVTDSTGLVGKKSIQVTVKEQEVVETPVPDEENKREEPVHQETIVPVEPEPTPESTPDPTPDSSQTVVPSTPTPDSSETQTPEPTPDSSETQTPEPENPGIESPAPDNPAPEDPGTESPEPVVPPADGGSEGESPEPENPGDNQGTEEVTPPANEGGTDEGSESVPADAVNEE